MDNCGKHSAALLGAAAVGSASVLWLLSRPSSSEKNERPRNQMFQDYPLGAGKAKLSTGDEVTLPYHIYDGWASAVQGTCSLEAAKRVCEKEDYQPVETESGRALGLISFWDFTQANTGPHTECQFTLLVTRKGTGSPKKVVPESPFGTLGAMIQDDVYLLITELYSNTELVVAYNNELLAQNAIHATTSYKKEKGSLCVQKANQESPLVQVELGQTEPRIIWEPSCK